MIIMYLIESTNVLSIRNTVQLHTGCKSTDIYSGVLLFLSTGGELLHISREEGVVLFSPITNTSNVIITPSTMVTHIQT